MKVRDYVSIIKGEVSINITFDGKKITEFKAPYWDTIEADIIDLEIRSVAFPGKSVIIETKTGRPTIVSTPAELEAAIADESIKFIKLGADISEADTESFEVDLSEDAKILDLAGHELSVLDSHAAIVVSGDAVLDVFDSECGGLVKGGDCVIASENATVRLHGGDYVGGGEDGENEVSVAVIANCSSKVYIYGGYYLNLEYDGDAHTVIEAIDDASITCFGGKFKDEDPSPYVADGYYSAAIPDTDPVVYEVKSIL